MSRFQTSKEYREWNDGMIQKHDPSAYYQSALVRWLEGFRIRAILAAAKLSTGKKRFLELGCGYGFVLREVASLEVCPEIYGADLSHPSLVAAAKLLEGKIQMALADATTPPFRKGSLDVICITEVLEHVPDPVAVLKAAGELLAPGGVLIVTAPNEALINRLKAILRRTGLWRLFFGKYDAADHMEDEWHLHVADRESLLRWVSQAGLTLRRVRGLPFGILPTRYLAVVGVLLPRDR